MERNIMSQKYSVGFRSGVYGDQSVVSVPSFLHPPGTVCILLPNDEVHCCAPPGTRGGSDNESKDFMGL